MLSLSNVSEQMGQFYFEKDDYYSRDNSPAPSEFVGSGARLLGLEKFSKDAYRNLLKGLSPDGQERLAYIKPKSISQEEFEKRCKRLACAAEKLGMDEHTSGQLVSIFSNRFVGKVLQNDDKEELNKEMNIAFKSTPLAGSGRKLLRREMQSMYRFLTRCDRRAAYDLTFNAPKSVSLEVLVNGNQRLLKAHETAVKFAISEVEKRCIGVLSGPKGARKFSQTSNLIGATFPHGTSREGDPHLHTHVVTFNITRRSDGKWRAINNDELYRQSTFLGLAYQNKLAELCQDLGYRIDVNANGTFELKGFSKRHLAEFSRRNTQVREASARLLYEKDFAAFLASEDIGYRYFGRFGVTHFKLKIDTKEAQKLGVNIVKSTDEHLISDGFTGQKSFENQKEKYLRQVDQKLTRTAVLKGRAVKGNLDYVDLAKNWRQRAKSVSLPSLPVKGRDQSTLLGKSLNLSFHEEHLSERSAIWTQLEASTQALKQNLGRASLSNIEKAVREHLPTVKTDVQPELKTLSHGRLTNLDQLSDEERILQFAKNGLGKFKAFTPAEKLAGIKEEMGFTEGQAGMVQGVLTSRDQLSICLGVAGSGKSYAAQSIKAHAEKSGRNVVGLAPDASSAQALQEKSGIESETIHRYITRGTRSMSHKTFTKHQIKFSARLASLGVDRHTLKGITVQIQEKFQGTRLSFNACEDLRAKILATTESAHNRDADKIIKAFNRLAAHVGEKQKLLLVDEASKLSTRLMRELTESVAECGDRLALMGDLRQTGAVEAGNPLKNLVDQKKVLVHQLLEPVRQKEGMPMRLIVDSASRSTKEGMAQSIEHLGDRIVTRDKKERRIGLAVKEYMKLVDRGDKDLMLIADLNVDRRSLTDQLRIRLKNKGIIDKSEVKLKVLASRELTAAQKSQARYYDLQDKIVFHENIGKCEPGMVYTVSSVDKDSNKLTLKEGRRSITIKSSLLTKAGVFKEEEISVSKGDTLRWTRNHAGRVNKHLVTVESVSKRKVRLRDVATGESMAVKPDLPNFLDYGLVMTVYSSQGHDRRSGIFLAESNVSMNSWYTALSRMKENVLVITDNKEKLLDRVSESTAKLNALEFMHQKSGWIERRNAIQHATKERGRAIEGPELER